MDWARSLAKIDERDLTTIFDLTNRCNLRCRQCYFSYDEVFYRKPAALTPDEFARIAQELLPRSKTVFLSATTEPLASPHFAEILEIAASHRPIEIKLLTNATLLTEEIADAFVRHGVSDVQVSIDGATAATFEHIRRGARFDRVLRNVAYVTEAKRRHGATAPRLQFNVTLMRSNLDELPGIVDLAVALGVEQIGCRHVVPYDELGMEEESLSREPLRANRGLAAFLARAAGAGVRIVNFPDYFPIDGRPWHPPTPAATARPVPDAVFDPDPRFANGPCGSLDGPVEQEFASDGYLDLEGWALDPSGPVEVRIERDRFLHEESGERIVLGKARFQNGRRPDVVAVFPDVPGVQTAGWVFHAKVRDPSWRTGTAMTIRAVAENAAGAAHELGSRSVVLRGDTGVAPWLYCHRPFSHVFVNFAGHLFPYPDCQGSDSYGVLEPGVRFEDLWFGEVATVLRRRILDHDPPEMCQRCPIFINRLVSDPKLFEARDTRSRYR
jgi:MoaA/NifB/PqqE/SkfB family radical SAM enzyme